MWGGVCVCVGGVVCVCVGCGGGVCVLCVWGGSGRICKSVASFKVNVEVRYNNVH